MTTLDTYIDTSFFFDFAIVMHVPRIVGHAFFNVSVCVCVDSSKLQGSILSFNHSKK